VRRRRRRYLSDLSDIKFNYFMGTLLRERSSDLYLLRATRMSSESVNLPVHLHLFLNRLITRSRYRSKGVLSIHGQGNTKFVFQGVHESINFGPAQVEWTEDETRVNKMVFIGKDLDKQALRDGFGKCSK
jgi:G3E family GTPase